MNAVYIGVGITVLLWVFFNSYRKRKNRNKVVSIIKSRCTGCRRCVASCTRRVLEAIEDETGTHIIVKYPTQCTACGNCLGKCKFNALELVKRT